MNRDVESGVIVIGFGGLGIILAFIVSTMNTKGIFMDEWLIKGTNTITDVMALIVIASLVIGVIIGAMRR